MKYTEFLHTIETEITARLDNNFKLTIHPVKKNNGMIYDGLVIINPKFVTLGHRYRNTNPRLNAKYPKDTSMLNNQHGRVSCKKKCPGYANQMRAVCDFDSLPMYILTNSRQTNGASAILYPGVLSSLAKKLGGNMLLIPSSIHEFLVMPLDSDIDVCNLSEFICEVNSTEVRDEEVLGERYYIYDSKTDTVY